MKKEISEERETELKSVVRFRTKAIELVFLKVGEEGEFEEVYKGETSSVSELGLGARVKPAHRRATISESIVGG